MVRSGSDNDIWRIIHRVERQRREVKLSRRYVVNSLDRKCSGLNSLETKKEEFSDVSEGQ